jgi:hypothetical protein
MVYGGPEDPYRKVKHKVTITFDLDMAEEIATELHHKLARTIPMWLEYPVEALRVGYSWDTPKPPSEMWITVKKVEQTP